MPNRLSEYRRKRDFAATPEPAPRKGGRGSTAPEAAPRRYVIHLHHARSRHFDLRLQVGNTLRSWAVPKGPSLDPANKRLAVEVEDHPLDYGNFEGTIPEGHYGAGKVWIWDEGDWTPGGDPAKLLKAGRLHFDLHGSRLHGGWSLVRTHLGGKRPQWLLMKSRDEAARKGDEADDTPLAQWLKRHPTATPARPKVKAAKKRKKSSAKRSALPASIGLQLAKLTERAPAGADWLHEVKFDGYRVLLWRDGDEVRITSRGDQDWTQKLERAAAALRTLPCASCVLDGELVATDAEGRSNFGLLQRRFGEDDQRDSLSVMIFDLLYLDGEDLRPLPQLQRKERLAALLEDVAAPLQLTSFVTGHGPKVAEQACANGLEGIISKAASAPYGDGRSEAWLKIKCVQSDEYAVIGYTTGKGSRAALGALLLATPDAERKSGWRYIGRVGTGFDSAMIEDLLHRFKSAPRPKNLENIPGRAELRGASPVWVKPELVVETEFRGLTEDGLLRQASLKGLRLDRSIRSLESSRRNIARTHFPLRKAAPRTLDPEVEMPAPAHSRGKRKAGAKAPTAEVQLSHPERVLFEKPRITKRDLAGFYTNIADFILPGLVNRPLLLMRCPDGAAGACFFQKHLSPGFPRSVREVMDPAEKTRWVYVDSLEGLHGLVQMNCLEFHVWGSTVSDLDHADRLVMDLDPAPGVPWKAVIKCALELRRRLQDLKLQSYVRTSGGKGLHLVVPVKPAADWETAKSFAHALAETLAQEQPERYVSTASKAKRGGKIFIDYLRNGRGSTAVASYSLRNRPGAPIATPLGWDELPRLRAPDHYDYDNIRRRLSRLGADPWIGIDKLRQSLPSIEP